jgi:hypothetical protein
MKKTVIGASIILAIMSLEMLASSDLLDGDQKAVALAERMLETLGGKAIWAQARTIRIELRGYYAREQEPWYETFWMDLENPRGRFELKDEKTERVIAWTPEGGWEVSDGNVEAMDSARHAFELKYWKRQPVVIFHRLARGIPATRVEMGTNEYRFDVFDVESSELLAQFAVNMKGEPIKWGSSIGEREFEHVFGPIEEFNNVLMPKWGATIAGIWRYEHKSVSLTQSQPPVSFDPPFGKND